MGRYSRKPSSFEVGRKPCGWSAVSDVDTTLISAKFDCAGDADDFPLDHSKSLIGRNCGPGLNKPSKRLIGVFSSGRQYARIRQGERQSSIYARHLDVTRSLPL